MGICEYNGAGATLCYGNAFLDEACDDRFDCMDGICLPETYGGNTTVCVPTPAACESLEIPKLYSEMAILMCLHAATCGEDLGETMGACLDTMCELLDNEQFSDPYGCADQVDPLLEGRKCCE